MERTAVLGGREYSAEELLDLLHQYVSEMERLWARINNHIFGADSGKRVRRQTRFFELRASAGLAVSLLRQLAQAPLKAGIFNDLAPAVIPPGLSGRLSLAMSWEIKGGINIKVPPEVSAGLTSRQRRILAGVCLIDLPRGSWDYSICRQAEAVNLRVKSKSNGGFSWELKFMIFCLWPEAQNSQFNPEKLKAEVCLAVKQCLLPQRDKLARHLAAIKADLAVLGV
ncbi:MAG: hypothetical protein A2663_04965 [Candidatus Buchananbacteria bacterium RIFCSPHIGHO2_01_FULL_46_12]|uniref:Uncharacterized protein n=2 Tax=Candidatus Buchananiibacteriota TaxID=1817903 RepID=A0A1G1Y433_9BACT|nr:MAG: hypothetical protein A2663_04965 [Candidatus Buchananbacteria bacterium RIFCSPHIGHO2_01_FULL_46_12]OGY56391.1 MAG: hypothetical protein A3H67_05175 [Candidatus Buchananbacteria bacterium RIFCSPLOWO2_02_FULL_46_11b]